MEAYTDSDFGACLDTRRSVSGAVLMLAKGAFSWHSRMQEVSIGYLGGRVSCFIRGGKGSSIFETGAGVHGTVDESRCSECVRRQ